MREFVEDPHESVKCKMKAHGYDYDDIDSDPENGYIVFYSDNGLFPSGGFRSWEEVSDWVNNVEFDESFNDVGVSEADEFGRPDNLFAKLAAIQSHQYDKKPAPSKEELRRRMDAEAERAKAAGKYVKLDSVRVEREQSSKYEETVVIPNWMVKGPRPYGGLTLVQWLGPSQIDSKKLELAGAYGKFKQWGHLYTNGYIACIYYYIPGVCVKGNTPDGGVKIALKLNRENGSRYKIYERPMGYFKSKGNMKLTVIGYGQDQESITTEEFLRRIDAYLTSVRHFGGFDNYRKMGDELRERTRASIEDYKRANAELAADRDAADAAMYGDQVIAKESAEEPLGPQLVDIRAFNIEWDPRDKEEEPNLPDSEEFHDIQYNPDEETKDEVVSKLLSDSYGYVPEYLECEVLDWKGEYETESVDITEAAAVTNASRAVATDGESSDESISVDDETADSIRKEHRWHDADSLDVHSGDRIEFIYGDDEYGIPTKLYQGTLMSRNGDTCMVSAEMECGDGETSDFEVEIPREFVVGIVYRSDPYYEMNRGTADESSVCEDGEETGAEQHVVDGDAGYPRPCDELFARKTVKAAQKFIYGSVSQYTKGLFHDEDWSHVRKVFDVLASDLGMNVNWGVRSDNFYQAGYSPDGKSKAYQFDAKYTNCVGRKVRINGQLIAHAAGTVDEPMKAYDMSFILF